ncbi:AraC family transcriptional regulator [Pseudoalteromonas sp. SMS1]|uniref:helix-turn-helix transcriptional regulator n=1 Tax=Pseudoalteromonas sp. SMS1 TaxID=2908894 RepID=UPI001F44258D|nr:AraC family transcriptional regulator [Pseudoalteromonas sp. SMS1]MCF2856982.1 AraC family transcriptional regulator [Pseudoalteromonas sp. SMS1]
MSEKISKPFVLVPEYALLAPLPEHLKTRFVTALKLMHQDLASGLCWEQIATQSAISPYHFHRQFSELFNETPGQYLSRLRLQYAVHYIFAAQDYKIIDIAQECGFSSSQALGKALKNALGLTAKEIRAMGVMGTPRETSELLAKLAHPSEADSLENTLAQNLPCELVWYPQRGMKVLPNSSEDWDTVFETFGEKSTRIMGMTPVNQLENRWQDIKTYVGDWQVPVSEYTKLLAEGHYFCCDVYLVSDTAYAVALEQLFKVIESKGYQLDANGYLVEIIRDIEMTETGGVTFSFQVPVMV